MATRKERIVLEVEDQRRRSLPQPISAAAFGEPVESIGASSRRGSGDIDSLWPANGCCLPTFADEPCGCMRPETTCGECCYVPAEQSTG